MFKNISLIGVSSIFFLANCGTPVAATDPTENPGTDTPTETSESAETDDPEVMNGSVEEEETKPVNTKKPSDIPVSGECTLFPADNPWNRDISSDPLDPNSDTYIENIGAAGTLHPDFGGDGAYGIPYDVVGTGQPLVPITITDYADESDPGPYPIPLNAMVEKETMDSHVIALDKDNCVLYELYKANRTANGWTAASAAKFNLRSNDLRPDYWTSADAAGLPILPGLVRYDEILKGSINHALRFTVVDTQKGFIHPATHFASDSLNMSRPPMGLRLRLKADYNIDDFTGAPKIILTALKKYGMILADNGENWFITGSTDYRWDDEELSQLGDVPGSAFEAVKTGEIIR